MVLIFSFFIYIRLFILSATRNKFKPVWQKVIVCAYPVFALETHFPREAQFPRETHVRPTHQTGVWSQIPPNDEKVFFVMQRKSQLSKAWDMSCHWGILGRKQRTEIIYHEYIIWVRRPVHALMISEYLHCIKCQRVRSYYIWEDVQFLIEVTRRT